MEYTWLEKYANQHLINSQYANTIDCSLSGLKLAFCGSCLFLLLLLFGFLVFERRLCVFGSSFVVLFGLSVEN